jgi:hypothetical protein
MKEETRELSKQMLGKKLDSIESKFLSIAHLSESDLEK